MLICGICGYEVFLGVLAKARSSRFMNNILEFINVGYSESAGFRFGDLNFSVNAGELVVVCGRVRDEESVLPKLCAGLVSPTNGTIKLFGRNLDGIPTDDLIKLRSEKMGFVFSKPTLMNNMRVKDNVALPLRYHTPLTEIQITKTVNERLQMAGILDYADRFPPELPAGIQKLVSVLRASVIDPEIVFYDEPIFELDDVASVPVLNLIKKINGEKKIASIIFTCQQKSVADSADRIIRISAAGDITAAV